LEDKIAFQLDMKKFDRDGDPNSAWGQVGHFLDQGSKWLEDHPWIRVGLAIATLGQSEVVKMGADGASYFIEHPNALTDFSSGSGKRLDDESAFLEQQLAALKAGGSLTPEQRFKLEMTLGAAEADDKQFLADRQTVVNAAATTVGVIAGAVVT